MPEVKPERILTFSSEDKVFPADNLLKVNAFSKWKCYPAGSKQATVTFKFDRPIQFNRLDIGNEGSAFVEVDVSRTGFEEYNVLLPSSSFMSPPDAKKGVGLNRVRIFSGNELTPAVASQKWDVVKVTCVQPFNKELQYGLAFIRFYCADVDQEDVDNRSGEESNESLKPGDLFRLAQSNKELGEVGVPTSVETAPAHPVTVMQKLVQEKQSDLLQSQQNTTPPPTPPLATSSNKDQQQPSSSAAGPSKRRSILRGVVVAFSGYKNPFRAELRDLCLNLGAKYRQDWSDDCTHLICAFPNTPKWNAVKGKGVITSHLWIKECHRLNRRVSWRPYRVGRAPSPVGYLSDTPDVKDENSDSDWERSLVEDAMSDDWKPSESHSEEEDDDDESSDATQTDPSNDDDDVDDREEDDDGDEESAKKATYRGKRLMDMHPNMQKAKKRRKLQPVQGDEDSTEESQAQSGNHQNNNTDQSTDTPIAALPDIFIGKKFCIFSNGMDAKEEEIVYRLIFTFGGKVESHLDDSVEFVISRSTWCDAFDDALNKGCPKLVFVKPEWIYACDKAGKWVPFQRYQIVG